jgi:hypothetical protein
MPKTPEGKVKNAKDVVVEDAVAVSGKVVVAPVANTRVVEGSSSTISSPQIGSGDSGDKRDCVGVVSPDDRSVPRKFYFVFDNIKHSYVKFESASAAEGFIDASVAVGLGNRDHLHVCLFPSEDYLLQFLQDVKSCSDSLKRNSSVGGQNRKSGCHCVT